MGYVTMNRRQRQERRTRDWRGFSVKDINDIGFDPYDLEHVLFQTEELCLYCVDRVPYFLEYVRDKTEAVCLRALKSDASAIQFIDEPSEEMVAVALDCSPDEVLCFVATQTPAICVAAVSRNSLVLCRVRAQSSEICVAAIVRSSQEHWRHTQEPPGVMTSLLLRLGHIRIPFDVPMASALVNCLSADLYLDYNRYLDYDEPGAKPPVLLCLPEAAEMLTAAGFEVALEWRKSAERL